MKLHLPLALRSALLACLTAFVAGSPVLHAADVTWDATNGDVTLNSFPLTETQVPAQGNIIKTGTGTYYISLDNATNDNTTIANTASTFAGDVTIEAGAIQLGKGKTGGLEGKQYVSGNALGSSGTIYVNANAALKLNITQNGTVAIGKAISLAGGTLEACDGNYNFNGGLTLTADSELLNDWGKTQTIKNLSAAGYKLTLTQDQDSGTIDFTGTFAAKELSVDSSMTVNLGKEAAVLSSFSLQTLSIAGGSTVNVATGGASSLTTSIDTVSLGSGALLNMVDGNFNYTTVTLAGNAELKQGFNKVVNITNLSGAGHTLTYTLNNRRWGDSCLNLTGALNLGGLTLRTTDTDASRNGKLKATISAANAVVGTLTVGQYTEVNVTGTGVSIDGLSLNGGTLGTTQNMTVTKAANKTLELLNGTLQSDGGSWAFSGAAKLDGMTLGGSGDISFTGGELTLMSTLTNSLSGDAVLSLTGALKLGSAVSAFTYDEWTNAAGAYSDGLNGYAQEKIVLVSGAADAEFVISMTIASKDGTRTYEVMADGSQTDAGDGLLHGTGSAYILERGVNYYVNSGDVAYADNTTIASDGTLGIVLNGGTLAMEKGLNSKLTRGVTLAADSGIRLKQGVTLDGSSLHVPLSEAGVALHTATLSGAGQYKVTQADQLKGVAVDGTAWTGDVRLERIDLTGQNLNLYGVAGSTLTLAGVTGYFANNSTYNGALVLENHSGKAGMDVTNGHAGSVITFAGGVSGGGNLVRTWNSDSALTFVFSGDVADWKNGAEIAMRDDAKNTHIRFEGAADTINVHVRDYTSNSGHTLTVDNSKDVAVNGEITGAFAVTYKGSGNKTVSGSNNSYTGGTTIESGKVVASAANALGAGNVTLYSGATLQLGSSGLKADNVIQGDTTHGSGTLVVDSASAVTIGNKITDGIAVTYKGSGDKTVANAGSTYTGGTTIESGKVVASAANALGAGNVTLYSGATLQLGISGLKADNVIQGDTTHGSGALVVDSASEVTIGNKITDGIAVTYKGSGDKTVTNAGSTYTGGTTIEGGKVTVSAANALGMGDVTINAGSLEVTASDAGGGAGFTRGSITVNAGGTLNLTKTDNLGWGENRVKTITLKGTAANGANMVVGERQTMKTDINMQGYATLSGSGSLNPYGGTISASGTNNTISAAIQLREKLTFDVTGELSLTGAITRYSEGTGGTLKTGVGTLTIGATEATGSIFNHGFTISEGAVVNDRTLTIQNLTLAEGASFTNNSALTLTGTVVLGAAITNTGSITFGSGALLDISGLSYVDEGRTRTYTFAVNSGSGSVSGLTSDSFTNLTTEGRTWDFDNANSGRISYTLEGQVHTATGTVTWAEGSSMGGESSFAANDAVKFQGTSNATLGGSVTVSDMTVASGAVSVVDGSAGNHSISAGSVMVESGASLELSGSGVLNADSLVLHGAITDSEGVVVSEAGKLIVSGAELAEGTVVRGDGQLIVENASAVTIGTEIAGGDVAVTYRGDGTKTVSYSNSYAGGTTIEEGEVTLTNATGFGSGAVCVQDGAALNVGTSSGGANMTNNVAMEGGTMNMTKSMLGGNTVTLGGTSASTITGNDAALRSSLEGVGDLALKGKNDQYLYVYSDASFKGKLEVTEGKVDFGHTGNGGATIRNTGDVNIKGATVGMHDGSTIKNDGDVHVSSGSLTVNSGTSIVNQAGKSGVVKVSGGSLVVNEGATMGREVNLGSLNGEVFTTKASISGIDGNATYKGVTVTATTISGGTLENAGVRVIDSGMAISGMTLKNTSLSVEEALLMNNVVLEGSSVKVTETGSFAAGSVVTLTGEANSLTAALVTPTATVKFSSASLGTENDYHSFTTSQLSGVTLAAGGMLTVDAGGAAFRELIVDASQQVEAVNGKQYYYVALTLQGFTMEQQVGYSMETPFADAASGLALGSLLSKGLVTGYELGADSTTVYMRFDAQSIPEPTTATLSLLALAALAARRRRR